MVVSAPLEVQSIEVEVNTVSRRVVTPFNHLGLAEKKLLPIQKELNFPQNQLVQDICTMWNSHFYIEERLLEQKRAIPLYVADHDTLSCFNCGG